MSTTTAQLTLRGSKMPLALKCPGSTREGESGVMVNPRNNPAQVGSAVHYAQMELVRDGEIKTPIAKIAAAHGADPDETQILTSMMRRMVGQVWQWVGSVEAVEEPLSTQAGELTVTGRPDVVFWWKGDDRHLGVFDLKTGRLDSDYYDQLAAYALNAMREWLCDRCTVIVGWLRENEVESYTFDRQEIEDWAEFASDRVTNWEGTFEPGTHCEHCARRHDCPARRAMMRGDLLELDETGDVEAVDRMVEAMIDAAKSDPDTADRLANLLEKAKQISNLADRVRSGTRDRLGEHGKPLVGRALTIDTIDKTRTEILGKPAWPILAKALDDEGLKELAKFGKTATFNALRELAPRGQKKRMAEDYEDELQRAGALSKKTHKELSIKRSAQSIEQRSK